MELLHLLVTREISVDLGILLPGVRVLINKEEILEVHQWIESKSHPFRGDLFWGKGPILQDWKAGHKSIIYFNELKSQRS